MSVCHGAWEDCGCQAASWQSGWHGRARARAHGWPGEARFPLLFESALHCSEETDLGDEMLTRFLWIILLGLGGPWGCSPPNPWVKVVVLDDGRLQVDGPSAGPFDTKEVLAENACKLMTLQPGASSVESTKGNVLVLGPAHPHPHNRQLSRVDMGADLLPDETPVGVARFYDSQTARIWDRDLLVFYQEPSGVCRTYNYATRIVSALRDGMWVQIGRAEGEYAEFKAFEGQDWLP
jgi:hypothetical protein